MTNLLKRAIIKAAELSHAQQDAFARWMLDELNSEKRWKKAFEKSQDILAHLADRALKEDTLVKTRPLHNRRF